MKRHIESVDKDELQRLADDEEVQNALEVLRLWGIDGVTYDKLVGRI